MASLKQLALDASEDAFKDGIRIAIRELMNGLILAKTDDDRTACVARHQSALQFHKTLHEASVTAINAAFP